MIKVNIVLGLAIVACSLLLTAQSAGIPESIPKINVRLVTAEELEQILQENPNAVELERKTSTNSETEPKHHHASPAAASRTNIAYTLGARNGYDQLVAYDESSIEWAYPRDVIASFAYPAGGGQGAVVTYVEILINQSNDSGRAYVTRGGVGYRYCEVVIEAYQTYWFDHRASFFGYY